MNKGGKTSFCQRHADGRERKRGPEAFLSGRIEMRSVVPLVHRQGTSARLGGNVHSFCFHRLNSGQLPVQMRFDA